MPSGTLGGRKHPTRTPCARSSAAAATACSGPGMRIEWTAPAPTSTCPASSGRRVKTSTAVSRARASRAAGSPVAAIRQAAAAEAASTGARAVSKTKVRAVLSTWSRQDRASGPPNRARPPWPPRAFEQVAVTTTGACPAHSPRAPVRLPPGTTPSEWASSTTSRAPCSAARAARAGRSASSPSTEYRDSTTSTIRRARPSVRSRSRAARKAGTLLCSTVVTDAPARGANAPERAVTARAAPSRRLAWACSSRRKAVPGPARAPRTPRFAV